jgi:type IV fimbrial biogenesis protein FimT
MQRRNNGFTLTEALVTITMIGIMASISVASLQPLQQKQRLAQAAQQVEQAIRKAQQTAIARSQRSLHWNNCCAPNRNSSVSGSGEYKRSGRKHLEYRRLSWCYQYAASLQLSGHSYE